MADYQELFSSLTKRYGKLDLEALQSIFCPLLIPLRSLDKEIIKIPGQNHFRASFSLNITDEKSQEILQVGRTGKFVPSTYVNGGQWQEIAKGRIIKLSDDGKIAFGEVYIGGTKRDLQTALSRLDSSDYLEVDQYGASAKILSSLVEYSLAKIARKSGYTVRRMPEDMAKHLGTYRHFDFEFEKGKVIKRIEVKSIWGTNTAYARLIHSKGKDHETSSCRFDAQDIFAVSLFLRTGNLDDFAFARSVPQSDATPYGLPTSSGFAEYVHQNLICQIGNGQWFGTIDDVWVLK